MMHRYGIECSYPCRSQLSPSPFLFLFYRSLSHSHTHTLSLFGDYSPKRKYGNIDIFIIRFLHECLAFQITFECMLKPSMPPKQEKHQRNNNNKNICKYESHMRTRLRSLMPVKFVLLKTHNKYLLEKCRECRQLSSFDRSILICTSSHLNWHTRMYCAA